MLDMDRLVERTAPKPLSATTWMVSGGEAHPAHQAPPSRPAPLPIVTNREAQQPPVQAGTNGKPGHNGKVHNDASQAPSVPFEAHAPAVTGRDGGIPSTVDNTVVQFQHLMDRFLETQEQVMLAYLHGQRKEDQAGGFFAPAQPVEKPAPSPAPASPEPPPVQSLPETANLALTLPRSYKP
jgi:hypothetical protein